MRLPPEKMIPNMNDTVAAMVKNYANSRTCKVYERVRSRILYYASQGWDNQEIAEEIGMHINTVGKWRVHLVSCVPLLNLVAEQNPKKLRKLYCDTLMDEHRSGAPIKYSENVRSEIKLIAVKNPKDYGFTISHWSLPFLEKAVKENVKAPNIEDISIGVIYNILTRDEIKPWKIQYWLHSAEKYNDYESFKTKVQAINAVYDLAAECRKHTEGVGINIYSFDEMTGTQALMHEHTKPVAPGYAEHVDPNYKRNGVLALTAFFDVVNGTVINGCLGATRTEEDLVGALRKVISQNPENEHIFICDNLNTHLSEGVVRLVAELIGYEGDLGKKNIRGILHNKASRMEFLGNPDHKIRFLFTPLHCSWLNQIEIWFGIINRQLLKRGNFESVEYLKQCIVDYIEQWNTGYAHPFKWSYNKVPSNPNADKKEEVSADKLEPTGT